MFLADIHSLLWLAQLAAAAADCFKKVTWESAASLGSSAASLIELINAVAADGILQRGGSRQSLFPLKLLAHAAHPPAYAPRGRSANKAGCRSGEIGGNDFAG